MANKDHGNIRIETGLMRRDQSWKVLGGAGTKPLEGGKHGLWLENGREGDQTRTTWR